MSRLGLRGCSGPFDWYYSDFAPVLLCIENEFSDFFARENLEQYPKYPRTFIDKKYGFLSFHDIRTDLDEDYPVFCKRYNDRAQRFLEAVKKPTCFFRAVRNAAEVKYILDNKDYIENLLRRYNKENEVIYLLPKSLGLLPEEFTSFSLNMEYKHDAYYIRALFDNNKELLDFCNGLLPPEAIAANKAHDDGANAACAAEVFEMVARDEGNVDKRILRGLEANPDEEIYLWGGGYHGKSMYSYLTGKGVVINGIIDINADKKPDDGIKYIKPSEVPEQSKIFISIADGRTNDEIMAQMAEKQCKFLTFKAILKLNDNYM